MIYYWKQKMHKGWINIINPFRGTIVLGTPGSGKSFGIIDPVHPAARCQGICYDVLRFQVSDIGQDTVLPVSARTARQVNCQIIAAFALSTLRTWSIPTASIRYSASTFRTWRQLRKPLLPCWHPETREAARRRAVRKPSSPTQRRTFWRPSSISS